MSDLDALYRELILDHSKNPQHFGLADDAPHSGTSHQKNPVCGDEITLRATVDGEHITAVTWEGRGCSISQASASMLADLVVEEGLDRAAAKELIDGFREALRSRGTIELDEDTFGDAAALSGVSKFSARVKCAMLAWVALEDALAKA
ncbi:SUF system NifU family Fe-S cluster assembly protein [Microbacterium sp. W1N]|uniref:Fe-S cluster assembly sulfur transfer protein SufU n=1 Tax=Microbacterium festucae TaxID=2977531 RepID=UPI0021C05034|nr:SUF system NifU family Fe-S cluster assembly protein [Microbacterium festucae]MCT9819388.1 SUF system NifU family Fe-S cluster assembly protein [Microbacterium festucae]